MRKLRKGCRVGDRQLSALRGRPRRFGLGRSGERRGPALQRCCKQGGRSGKDVGGKAIDVSKPVADKVVETTKDVGHKAYDAAKPVADKVVDTAKDVGHKAYDVSKDTAKKAKDKLK